MERVLLVHLSLEGTDVIVGRLWTRHRAGRETSSFEYDATWLARPDAFALDPELPLARAPAHSARALFNVFADTAPDRWGQTLLRRHERARARREGRPPRTLLDSDFLVLVDDETRLGALRFQAPGDDGFLASSGRRVPPLLDLPKLLSAATRITEDRETDDDLQLVLAPGTSLGGARPKASVRDRDDHLLVAKFPRKDDEWPVTRWEATTLALGRAAGITVPTTRLEPVARRPVVMVRRFDRRKTSRIAFMSALTALSASDHETRSYLELAEVIRRSGSAVSSDLAELWRRIVFNILVSNTDDHLRNHGFLRDATGWRLAPAFDLNPMPLDVKPRVHALAIDETDATGSLELALSVAPQFGLTVNAQARTIADEVGRAVRRWRRTAAMNGLTAAQIERMESAFEHDDLAAALR
jgi:serine/threonine-protein kinase HipA